MYPTNYSSSRMETPFLKFLVFCDIQFALAFSVDKIFVFLFFIFILILQILFVLRRILCYNASKIKYGTY